MSEGNDEATFAREWLQHAWTRAPSQPPAHALETALSALWRRASRSLSASTLQVLTRVALIEAARTYPAAASLASSPSGVDCAALTALPVEEAQQAAQAVLASLLSILITASGGVLAAPLRETLAALHASAAPPSLPPSTNEGVGAARRLEALYALGRALSDFDSIEQALPRAAAAIGAALPLAILALSEKREGRGRLALWHATGAPSPRKAEDAARRAHARLCGSDRSEDAALEVTHEPAPFPSDPAGEVSSLVDNAWSGPALVLPLSARGCTTPCGVFFAIPRMPLVESDLEFADAAAHQIASALELSDAFERSTAGHERADVAARAQREMLSMVVHDLRNPLSAVLMSATLLLRSLRATSGRMEGQRQLEVIKRSADRMNQLLRNLSEINRMDAGRLIIEPQEHDATAIVTDGLRQIETLMTHQGVRLTSELPEGLGALAADRERAVQCVANLVAAALSLVGGAESTIVVRAQRMSDEVEFSVSENVSTLTEQDLLRVFDRRWWMARGALATGLGLAVVKGIAEAHGGRAWAEPVRGGGTRLAFTLPAARTRAAG